MALMGSTRRHAKLFERLVQELHDPVFHFFRRRGIDIEDSLDLTQDTFFRVFTHIERLRAEAASTTWILTIAANCWKNWLRKRAALKRGAEETSLDSLVEETAEPQPSEILPGGSSQPQDPLYGFLTKERLDRAMRIIDRMPPRQRRCMRLSVFQERSYAEIATLLEISEQTVKSHIHQARKRLDRDLAQEMGDAGLVGSES